MYLTDDREKTIKDIITQVEPELFEKVTGLTLSDFKQLVDAGVVNDAKMNDAVWKFRSFEEPSLHYEFQEELDGTVGGWTLRRDERFAHLIDKGIVSPGDELYGIDDLTAVALVTDNYGLGVGGVRLESPDAAAAAVGHQGDGWAFWGIDKGHGPKPLAEFG